MSTWIWIGFPLWLGMVTVIILALCALLAWWSVRHKRRRNSAAQLYRHATEQERAAQVAEQIHRLHQTARDMAQRNGRIL